VNGLCFVAGVQVCHGFEFQACPEQTEWCRRDYFSFDDEVCFVVANEFAFVGDGEFDVLLDAEGRCRGG